MKVERRAPGARPYAKPPMEGNRGEVVARWRVRTLWGIWRLSCLKCEYKLFCDMARTLRMGEKHPFRRPCNFKELRVVKKGTHYNFFALCA